MRVKPFNGGAIYGGMGGNGIASIHLQGSLTAQASLHDTTDDIELSVSNGTSWVEVEFRAAEAEAFAKWVLEVLADRRSEVGQAEKKERRREAEEHAGKPIVWSEYE